MWWCVMHGCYYLWELEMTHSHSREQIFGVGNRPMFWSCFKSSPLFFCILINLLLLSECPMHVSWEFKWACLILFSTVWPQILTCSQEVMSQVLFPSVFELGVFWVSFKQWLRVKDWEREEVPLACWSEERLSLPTEMIEI